MNPLLLGGLGLGGFLVYKLIEEKKKQPTQADYQSVTFTASATGLPMTVATPVSSGVTSEQATGMSLRPPTVGPVKPVPTSTNEGTLFAPQGSVQVTPSGDVTQPAPIVVTPGGSASMAVGNTLDIQRALNTLGYQPKLAEDGQLGPKTTANIKQFQSRNHLPVDGIAGPATKASLSAALLLLAGGASLAGATAQYSNPATGVATTPGGATVDTTPALGWNAKQVQHALNQLGATPKLTEDGQAGPKTIAAIKSFQSANGLTPDGVAGPKTKTALYLSLSQVHPTGA